MQRRCCHEGNDRRTVRIGDQSLMLFYVLPIDLRYDQRHLRLQPICAGIVDDQCTGANPRYPLISELKQILLDTYYGRDYVEGETAAKKEAAPAKAEKKAKKSA